MSTAQTATAERADAGAYASSSPRGLAADHEQPEGSLTDDLSALFEDGKTYAQAELAFQKSRAGFVAGQGKTALVYGLGALAFLHLALIALTVGLVLALIPLVGAWLATAIVTLVLLVAGGVMLFLLKGRADEIRGAFSESGHG